MIRFRYSAVDSNGKARAGRIEATEIEAARATLRDKGLLPLSVAQTGGWRFEFGSAFTRHGSRPLSPTDLAVFTRQMATLLGSGVQVEAALATLARQASPRLAATCRALRQAILDGANLSTALRDARAGFDRFYLTSVRAGERAGQQGAVLAHLADHAEGRLHNRQTVALALIYPAILIVVSIAVVVGLLVFLLPDIVRVFATRGADLPPLTKLMIGLSNFLTGNAVIVIGIALALLIGVTAGLRLPVVQHAWHTALWRSGLARQMTIVQFSGTLATLTQSGVPLADALSSATATVSNQTARDILAEVARDVRDGVPMSRALARQNGFPPIMITMIASGEAGGSLPTMLGRFAQDQSLNLQARVKTLVSLVEPLVLLGMGGVVMLLVLAILLPIVNLNSLVG
ncbi:type II secretion system F family protein [uncultured Tateyamaria sp.]|uniref:type II secretion system F family protein n=1 Tax=uncultured Tateyamaria sp. TaxID=455651 RepID=UPI002618F248|nr:type II secretion system F family protein [uncultured Tateyamaria sp.]